MSLWTGNSLGNLTMQIQKFLKTVSLSLILLFMVTFPVRSELDFGLQAEYQGDYELALNELQPLAQAGNARAQLWLGLIYFYGWGVPFNPRKAELWITRSASQLYQDAEFTLCIIMQRCSHGGPQNTN